MSSSKERILDCAQDLFHLQGYRSTSVDDILKRAKVTKSNFYYHFKSKEELALLTLSQRINEYEKNLFAPTLGNTALSPEKRLRSYYNKLISLHKTINLKKGCPFGNLALEISGVNEKFRRRISEFFDHWQKQIELCIKDGIKQKQFRDDISPKSLSQLILSHTEGAIMLTKTHKSISALSSGSKLIMKLTAR